MKFGVGEGGFQVGSAYGPVGILSQFFLALRAHNTIFVRGGGLFKIHTFDQ